MKKRKKNNIFMMIWIVLAVICMIYGVIVREAGSGTAFFLVWFGLGGLFLIFAGVLKTGLWERMPGILHTCFYLILAIGLAMFLIIEGQIAGGFREKGKDKLDYIIVLGAQVRKNGPSSVLTHRLNTAAAYLKDNPRTQCIVSGGQGYNEPSSEAEAMEQYLIRKGIKKDRILQENKSRNTRQNLIKSSRLIREGSSIGIVTNNFHVYRACRLANDLGIKPVWGIAAPSKKLYLPNNMFREFFAVLKYYLTKRRSYQVEWKTGEATEEKTEEVPEGMPEEPAEENNENLSRTLDQIQAPYDGTEDSKYLTAVLEVAQTMVDHEFIYNLSGIGTSLSKAVDGNHHGDCAHLVSWALQKMGVLEPDQTFYAKKKGLLSCKQEGKTYKKLTEAADFILVDGIPFSHQEELKKVLKVGDICCYNKHMNIVAGLDEEGNVLYYDAGLTPVDGHKSGGKYNDQLTRPYPRPHSHNKLYRIIRLR